MDLRTSADKKNRWGIGDDCINLSDSTSYTDMKNT